MARAPLSGFIAAIALINQQLDGVEKRLRAWHKSNAQSKRLETIPGVGLIGATALCALVPDPKLFRNGRHFAAWIGITPRLDGTGGKVRLGRISKAGDGALRRLFVLGATALLRSLANKTTPLALWVQGLLTRRSGRAAAVALANKLARMAWAIMASGKAYSRFARRSSKSRRGVHERPGPLNPGAVLAAVNTASRRVPRWPCGQC